MSSSSTSEQETAQKVAAEKGGAQKAAAEKAAAEKAAAEKAAAEKAAAQKAAAQKAAAEKAAAEKAAVEKAAAEKAAAEKAAVEKAAAGKAAAEKAAVEKAAAEKAAAITSASSATEKPAGTGSVSGTITRASGSSSGSGSSGTASGGASGAGSGASGGTTGGVSGGAGGGANVGTGGSSGSMPSNDSAAYNSYSIKDDPSLTNWEKQSFELGIDRDVCWYQVPGYKKDHTEHLKGTLKGEVKVGTSTADLGNGTTANVELRMTAQGALKTNLEIKINNFSRDGGKLFAPANGAWIIIGVRGNAQLKWTTATSEPQVQTQPADVRYAPSNGPFGSAGGDSTIQTGQTIAGSGSEVVSWQDAIGKIVDFGMSIVGIKKQ